MLTTKLGISAVMPPDTLSAMIISPPGPMKLKAKVTSGSLEKMLIGMLPSSSTTGKNSTTWKGFPNNAAASSRVFCGSPHTRGGGGGEGGGDGNGDGGGGGEAVGGGGGDMSGIGIGIGTGVGIGMQGIIGPSHTTWPLTSTSLSKYPSWTSENCQKFGQMLTPSKPSPTLTIVSTVSVTGGIPCRSAPSRLKPKIKGSNMGIIGSTTKSGVSSAMPPETLTWSSRTPSGVTKLKTKVASVTSE
mmetsp:Transcript_5833/g.21268  ORF Transcript_5833/g.21268 Transcript_5833/m.21268 type:complete len:244 (+) Transcript_5833:793-1524(+)